MDFTMNKLFLMTGRNNRTYVTGSTQLYNVAISPSPEGSSTLKAIRAKLQNKPIPDNIEAPAASDLCLEPQLNGKVLIRNTKTDQIIGEGKIFAYATNVIQDVTEQMLSATDLEDLEDLHAGMDLDVMSSSQRRTYETVYRLSRALITGDDAEWAVLAQFPPKYDPASINA